MSGFVDNLNIQNCENSTGNCVRKIDYKELWKFNGKLCTLHMYGMSGFAEKLNIQNCENSTGNCVYYMRGMSGLAEKLNIQNCVYSMKNCVQYIFTECLDM